MIQAGYCIGMTFQIIDDCLDYLSKTATIGKNVANDIKQGDMTLPLLFALQKDSSGVLKKLVFESSMTQENVAQIQELVIKYGGVAMAEEKAREYGADALKAISKLKKSQSRAILESMVASILQSTRS